MAGSDDLGEVRQRREALLGAVAALEVALAAPALGERWRDGVGNALSGLRATLAEHVAATEASDGILNRLRAEAPRLNNQLDRMIAEHGTITAGTDDLIDRLHAATEWTADEVDAVRERALELLRAIVRHRHRGSDLIYEAYNVDIGGSG